MSWPLPIGARGCWVKVPAVEVIESLANAGIDFVVLDQEHGSIDDRSLGRLVLAGRACGIPVFVRTSGITPREVQPALDAGAEGVFLPHIDSAEAARAMVDACRVPPVGRRHVSPMTRAGGWGALERSAFVQRANTGVALVAQIESPAAVEAIDEILRVDGFDAVFIGPFDLSVASGLGIGDAAFAAMVSRVEDAARGRRVLGGVPPYRGVEPELVERGYGFVMIGSDVELLADGARARLTTAGFGAGRRMEVDHAS